MTDNHKYYAVIYQLNHLMYINVYVETRAV